MTELNHDAAIVFLHAHPDDESILTGATLAKAQDLGLRTIVVFATHGDAGETNADLAGEPLGERRRREAETACEQLGVARVEWLPYADSGMAGTETTSNPDAFSNADSDVLAAELADLLQDETVYAIVGYDDNGTYGHPDHVQVHRVAYSAGPKLGADWVLEATWNREAMAALPDSDGELDPNFASPEADLTHFVAGDELALRKLEALSNHVSQIPDDFDPDNPDVEGFVTRFGTEWYIAASVNGATDLGPLTQLLEPVSGAE